jgi:hypothetical protein
VEEVEGPIQVREYVIKLTIIMISKPILKLQENMFIINFTNSLFKALYCFWIFQKLINRFVSDASTSLVDNQHGHSHSVYPDART